MNKKLVPTEGQNSEQSRDLAGSSSHDNPDPWGSAPAIRISERLNYCLGTAFRYLYEGIGTRATRESPIIRQATLRRVIWYLKREASLRECLPHRRFHAALDEWVSPKSVADLDWPEATQALEATSDQLLVPALSAILLAADQPYSLKLVEKALDAVYEVLWTRNPTAITTPDA